ncbi:MAG: 6-phosphogluconolactonase, partial [Chlorobia bacterium]|nr:6-phosphogluconolactonase [Fimbriimonadaceae bacterium]
MAKVERPQFLNKSEKPITVALSGGSTPKRAYDLLSKSEIDRSKIELYMVDERYVPIEDERSNEAMIRSALQLPIPLEEESRQDVGSLRGSFPLFPMYKPGGVAEAAADYNQLLRERVGKFDVVLLGMGDDGHTASIFPRMWPEIPLNEFCVA